MRGFDVKGFLPFSVWRVKKPFKLKEVDINEDISVVAGFSPRLVWVLDRYLNDEAHLARYLTGREWDVPEGQCFTFIGFDYNNIIQLRGEKGHAEIVTVLIPDTFDLKEYFEVLNYGVEWQV